MNEPEKLTIKVNDIDSITALLYPAAKKNRTGTTIILGHGAGANQLSPFMRLFASGLAERGLDALTFNFVYMENRRGAPDQKAKLESCYSAVIDTATSDKKLKGNRLLVGGKSMGGRIASQVAAAGDDRIAGLVFLGYPLHPPGQPQKLRTDHWPSIKAPMLFVQGTRDSLGTPKEIKPILKKLKLPAEIYEIETGDHSFKVQKSAGVGQDIVYERAMDRIVEWSRMFDKL
ncbi:MAG TPA: alpha/beta family hydrolase [Pyrinomonadaceae bacterium]|nr:alpha/beta family hydrolase [Pyrinomonadaceae bacterium]